MGEMQVNSVNSMGCVTSDINENTTINANSVNAANNDNRSNIANSGGCASRVNTLR